MQTRCTAQKIEKARLLARSWRKAAEALNQEYGVNLSHTTWRDYAKGRREIADIEIRAKLHLPARTCPTCGKKIAQRKPAGSNRKPKVRRAQLQPVFLKVIDSKNALHLGNSQWQEKLKP